jgi:hypothetical protein
MNFGIPKSPFSPSHPSLGCVDSSTPSAHFIARCKAWRPSIPNTYRGRRQLMFNPVICRGQPQSDPGTGWGTPIVSTTGFPLGNWNTRRAAIRRIVRGAAKDLLMGLSEMVSGGGAEGSTRTSVARVDFAPPFLPHRSRTETRYDVRDPGRKPKGTTPGGHRALMTPDERSSTRHLKCQLTQSR